MLEGIGKIHDYAQMKSLRFRANYKMKTGLALDAHFQENKAAIEVAQTVYVNKADNSDSFKINMIKNKLKRGKKLSTEEMTYLKEHDEALYRKAKNAEDAREDLEKDLKQAKTKQQAKNALLRAQLKATSEAISELKSVGTQAAGGTAMGGATGAAMGGTAGAAVSPEAAAISSDGGTEPIKDIPVEQKPQEPMTTDEAKKILASTLKSINDNISENQKDENRAEKTLTEKELAKKEKESTLESLKAQANSQSDKKKLTLDIVENLLYKLSALKDCWNEFIHTKAYKDLPEDDSKSAKQKKKSRSALTLSDSIGHYKKKDLQILLDCIR